MHPANVRIIHKPIESWTHPKGPTQDYCRFKTPPGSTISGLRCELARIGVGEAIIQMDLEDKDIRNDGQPRANANPERSRIIVSFVHPKQGALSYPCWTFPRWIDNVRAVSKTLEALRAMDRYGATRTGQQYTGWKALPPGSSAIIPAQAPSEDMDIEGCAELLIEYADQPYDEDLVEEVSTKMEVLKEIYKQASRNHHPDAVGGGDGDIIKINKAYEYIKQNIEAMP